MVSSCSSAGMQMSLDRRTAQVVSPLRTITGTGTHCAVSSTSLHCGVGARRVTETKAKFTCEMRVVVKATRVGNRADRLSCVQQPTAIKIILTITCLLVSHRV